MRPLLFWKLIPMRTIAYVDGMNLYFRILSRCPSCKWLNIKQLAVNVLSKRNFDLVSPPIFQGEGKPGTI